MSAELCTAPRSTARLLLFFFPHTHGVFPFTRHFHTVNVPLCTLFGTLIALAKGEGIAFGSVCLSLSTQNFRVFLRSRLSDWDEIFTIGATTHAECFNDNYDVIGHVVWHPYWKNGKTLDLCISDTAPRKKLKLSTWQVILMGNKCDFFKFDIIGTFVMMS